MTIEIRLAKEMRRYNCPFCGLIILADDFKRTFHHEMPMCEEFAKKMEDFGLKPEKSTIIWTRG